MATNVIEFSNEDVDQVHIHVLGDWRCGSLDRGCITHTLPEVVIIKRTRIEIRCIDTHYTKLVFERIFV